MVFNILMINLYDFCQNDGEVIETEEETPLYESVDDQERVGC